MKIYKIQLCCSSSNHLLLEFLYDVNAAKCSDKFITFLHTTFRRAWYSSIYLPHDDTAITAISLHRIYPNYRGPKVTNTQELLVKHLRQVASSTCRQAADLLEEQATRIAALEKEQATSITSQLYEFDIGELFEAIEWRGTAYVPLENYNDLTQQLIASNNQRATLRSKLTETKAELDALRTVAQAISDR